MHPATGGFAGAFTRWSVRDCVYFFSPISPNISSFLCRPCSAALFPLFSVNTSDLGLLPFLSNSAEWRVCQPLPAPTYSRMPQQARRSAHIDYHMVKSPSVPAKRTPQLAAFAVLASRNVTISSLAVPIVRASVPPVTEAAQLFHHGTCITTRRAAQTAFVIARKT